MTFLFFSSRGRHTIYWRDWSSDVCSSDLGNVTDLSAMVALSTGSGVAAAVSTNADLAGADARAAVAALARDRKSVVSGKSADLGGRGIIKKLRPLFLWPPPSAPS